MKNILKDRYVMLGAFFMAFGLAITLQLANLQVIHGAEYNEQSQRKVLRERMVVAPRGNIIDRYGAPIAVNRQGFTVDIVKTGAGQAQLNAMALKLVDILESNGDTYNTSLSKYLAFGPVTFGGRSWDEVAAWEKNEDILNLKDDRLIKSPEDVFAYLKKMFEISDGYTDEDAYKIMTIRYEILKNKWSFDNGNAVPIAKDVRPESVAEIEEQHHLLPGVITDIVPVRKYVDGFDIAHVLGYVGMINPDQYQKLMNEGYKQNDIIGQTGIESAAERYLRGVDGTKKIEVNTSGRLTDELYEKPAVPGNNVVLTIDMGLQKEAMESLARNIEGIRKKGGKNNFGDANAGAVVALDINSGEVLALASYPSYDPSIFLAGPENKDAQKAISSLWKDENAPAYNRAIQGTYAPGSTFKPLTAIAALEEGIITPDYAYNDTGHVNIGNMDFYCLEYKQGLGPHGTLGIEKALATSCNIFFHWVGYKTGIDSINKWGKLFGLGEYTGIELPGEKKGIRAGKESKMELRNDVWRPADTAQTAIGQFDNLFTPVQLANYISAIANGGKLYKPHLVKEVVKYDGSIVNNIEPVYEDIPVKDETIKIIQKGMVAVANSVDGTAVEVFEDFPVKVAGKTGTAETGSEANHSSNALFVCYAPADNPQIAVAVVVEKGVWGANTAPIARDVLSEYFGLNGKGKTGDEAKPDSPYFTR